MGVQKNVLPVEQLGNGFLVDANGAFAVTN
jgi:hypothetical protein